MEIKNEIMGVENYSCFVDLFEFLRLKIRTDGFLKFNNSNVFKNTKIFRKFPQKCIKN
jgi:hypothetical protein